MPIVIQSNNNLPWENENMKIPDTLFQTMLMHIAACELKIVVSAFLIEQPLAIWLRFSYFRVRFDVL